MMYVRYPLSLRQVEDLLHERGIDVSYEAVRFWWNRFGTLFAKKLKQRQQRFHQGPDNCVVLMQGTSVHPDFNDVSSLAGTLHERHSVQPAPLFPRDPQLTHCFPTLFHVLSGGTVGHAVGLFSIFYVHQTQNLLFWQTCAEGRSEVLRLTKGRTFSQNQVRNKGRAPSPTDRCEAGRTVGSAPLMALRFLHQNGLGGLAARRRQ